MELVRRVLRPSETLTQGVSSAAYARAGATEQRTYDGVTHEFFGLGNLVGSAKDAEGFAVAKLKKSFGSSTM